MKKNLLCVLLLFVGAVWAEAQNRVDFTPVSVQDSVILKKSVWTKKKVVKNRKRTTVKAKRLIDVARADFKLKMDYPTSGNADVQNWLQQWVVYHLACESCESHVRSALRKTVKNYVPMEKNTAGTASENTFQTKPQTIDSMTARYKHYVGEAYTGKLSDGKAVADWIKKLYLYSYRVDNRNLNYACNYGLNFNLSVVYQSPTLVTYNDEGYDYTGGAHGMPFNYYYSFDLENKKTVTPDEIFRPEALPQVRRAVVRELCKYFEVAHNLDSLKNQLFADSITTEDKFPLPQNALPGLTKDGIVIRYSSYEIACYAAGQPTAVLSYKEAWDWLTPYAQSLLKKP